MKLVQAPSSDLLAYVGQIQQQLYLHSDGILRHDNDTFLDRLRQTFRCHPAAISEEQYNKLSPSEKLAFGVLYPPEALRRVKQVAALATPFGSASHLFDFLDFWFVAQDLIQSVASVRDHDTTPIFISTASCRDHNARTFPHPDSKIRVIMFYDKLLDFIEEMSFIFPLAVLADVGKLSDHYEFTSSVNSTTVIQVPPGSTIEACLRTFLARYSRPSVSAKKFNTSGLSETVRLVAQDINLAAKAFILSHEIAHVLCDHKGKEHNWHLTALPEGETSTVHITTVHITEEVHTWDQEYEADYIGFKLGWGICQSQGISFEEYVWSVMLFFMSNQWSAALSGWDEEQIENAPKEILFRRFPTHPPLPYRLRWIKQVASQETASHNALPLPESINYAAIESLNSVVQTAIRAS